MTTLEQTLRDGRLQDALAGVQDRIRANPADAKQRIFLFQLLAILGEWQRALTQLQVVAELDAATLPMVHTYREAIRCEGLRADVFAGRATPQIFGEPKRWLALLLEALRLTAAGHADRAAALHAEAFDLSPATAGSIDGAAFEWIADADSRLGPVLEAIVNGVYFWVPFERLAEVRIEPPADVRDLVWAPAHFVWANGGEAVGLVPARYPGTEACDDPPLRLGRRTEWRELGADAWAGLGQRMLATDQGEYPLLDVRLIALNVSQSTADEAAGQDGGTPAADGDA